MALSCSLMAIKMDHLTILYKFPLLLFAGVIGLKNQISKDETDLNFLSIVNAYDPLTHALNFQLYKDKSSFIPQFMYQDDIAMYQAKEAGRNQVAI
jgi:hypothetical protein